MGLSNNDKKTSQMYGTTNSYYIAQPRTNSPVISARLNHLLNMPAIR